MDTWGVCGNKGYIEKSKFTATGSHVAAYGKRVVSKGVCEWKVRYNITSQQPCREIGIADNRDVMDGYIYKTGIVWYNCAIYNEGVKAADVSNINNNNDVITIKLDLHQQKVFFYKNDEKSKMVTVNVEPNKSWRLAAHLDTNGQSFTILSCDYTPPSSEMFSLQDVKNVVSQKMQQLNEFQMNELSDMTVNDLLSLQQKADGANQEFKELEQSLDEVKSKFGAIQAAVLKAVTPDASKYKSWSATDIVRYVCLLGNGKFAKYSDALQKACMEQEIDGSNLLSVEKNDLFTMGIKSFNDRTAIYKHFQALGTVEKEGTDTPAI